MRIWESAARRVSDFVVHRTAQRLVGSPGLSGVVEWTITFGLEQMETILVWLLGILSMSGNSETKLPRKNIYLCCKCAHSPVLISDNLLILISGLGMYVISDIVQKANQNPPSD